MDIQGQIDGLGEWQEVRVRWRDAYSPASGWHTTADYEPEDSVATTIGRVWVGCQEHYLTVVGTIFECELPNPETVGDINHIPLGWILSVDPITPYRNYTESI